jgi:hypothetical protein
LDVVDVIIKMINIGHPFHAYSLFVFLKGAMFKGLVVDNAKSNVGVRKAFVVVRMTFMGQC